MSGPADTSIGEVEIILDGKSVILKSTHAAAKRVNACVDGVGYMAVQNRLGTMDHETYVAVVAAGLDKKPSEVDAAVYRTGLPNLTKLLLLYVTYLANGGKPLAEDTGSGEA